MFTLFISDKIFPTPKDSVEYVYSAVETNNTTGEALNLVCYRTQDGKTHQSIVNDDGTFVVRLSVEKMKK